MIHRLTVARARVCRLRPRQLMNLLVHLDSHSLPNPLHPTASASKAPFFRSAGVHLPSCHAEESLPDSSQQEGQVVELSSSGDNDLLTVGPEIITSTSSSRLDDN